MAFAPKFNDPDFTIGNTFSSIYPNRAFDEKLINRLLSKLFTLTKKYLTYIYCFSEELNEEQAILEFYKNRLPEFFDNQLNRMRKINNKTKLQNRKFYANNFKIEFEFATYLSLKQPKKNRNLETLSEAFDTYYWVTKLSQLCDILNHRIITNFEYDLSLLDETLAYLEKTPSIQQTIIKLWYLAVITLYDIARGIPVNSKNYYELKQLIIAHKDILSKNDFSNLFTYLNNALKKTSIKEQEYYVELFEQYQLGLELELLYRNGYLLPQSVKNIVTIALHLNKVDWAKGFLIDYGPKIQPQHAEAVFTYNTALINFYQGNFQTSHDLLLKLEYKDIFFQLGKRIMLLQIYYELELLDPFYNLVSSFRKFLSLHKGDLSERHIQANRNFINILNSIAYILKGDTPKIKKLEQEIEAIPANALPKKKWLKRKLVELS